MLEINDNDIDIDKLVILRNALKSIVKHNPIIGQITEFKNGKITKSLIRLKNVPRKYRRKFKKIINKNV